MKKNFFLLPVILLELCGCSFTREENAFDEFGGYTELLMEYERVLEDPTYTEDKWENIYDHIGRFVDWENSELCYCIKDLSGDDKPELILGGRHGSEYSPMIIYAYVDGEYIWSCISENYHMEIYENGVIEIISGGLLTNYMYFQLERDGTATTRVEYLGTKGEKDDENLLYFQHTDEEEYKDISKEEFTQLRNRYTKNKEKLGSSRVMVGKNTHNPSVYAD